MKELWQEICFILKDIPPACNEELYEQKIIQTLEKLGWSRFHKEIVLKQSHQLGSVGTIIPDIIVKLLVRKESFVIEVKKPSADIESSTHKNQLFSYMRQLKLPYGLLFGNKIQIYYDGQSNKTESPILLKTIEISESDESGVDLINLFQKQTFSYQHLENFAQVKIKELATEKHQKKLCEFLISPEYQKTLQQFIINDLQQNWDNETIKSVLAQVSIKINLKTEKPQKDIQPPFLVQNEMKIAQLVRSCVSQIITYCENNKGELKNLQSPTYSKQTFNINYPFIKKVKSDTPKQDRYWKDKYQIEDEYFVITSEWFKGSLPLFKSYLAKIQRKIDT